MQPERAPSETAIVAPDLWSRTPVFAALSPRQVRARRLAAEASDSQGRRSAPSKPAILGLVALLVMAVCAVLALVAALRMRESVRFGRRV